MSDGGNLEEAGPQVSQFKRELVPEWWGAECPVCGEPFDAGSAGAVFGDGDRSIDAVAWVRVCQAPISSECPDLWTNADEVPDHAVMEYVHKDEHIDDV